MKIMVDTNVILDDILNRVPNAEAVRKISQLATDDADLSVPTISPVDFLLKLDV